MNNNLITIIIRFPDESETWERFSGTEAAHDFIEAAAADGMARQAEPESEEE